MFIKGLTVSLFVLLRFHGAYSIPTSNNVADDQMLSSARSLVPNCDGVLDLTCLKINFLSLIESLPSEYTILNGITIKKKVEEDPKRNSEKLKEISRTFPNDPDQRVDSYLAYKLKSFLETHSLELKSDDSTSARGISDYFDVEEEDDDDDEELEDDDEEVGRKKKKKKKKLKKLKKSGLGPLLLIVGLFKAMVGSLFGMKIFFMAKKALFVSVIALAVAASLALGSIKAEEEKTEGTILNRISHGGKVPSNVNFELPEHLSRVQN